MQRIHFDHTLLIFCAAIFLFNSPLTDWWTSLDLGWYAMFIPWAVIIVLVAVNQKRQSSRGD